MFEKLTCYANAEFELCAEGPVLVSSGQSHKTNPTLPDKTFMKGYVGKNHSEECYVIPGSSIKGVLRHHIQDFYLNGQETEGLFGKIIGGAQKSKIKFNDAFAVPETIVTAVRNSTKIDPNSQSPVGGSLNNMEIVEKGTFKAGFQIKNFTLKEIEMLLLSLHDSDTGAVRFGGKVSRGFGKMKIGSFMLTACKGYDKDLNPIDKVTFFDIEEAIKFFREVK
ncbi:MAG: hypothetical protein J5997_02425 [Oscillospiraceae bacterium]|nr:hypothetical protein [Oscillospiraceae bacterium]